MMEAGYSASNRCDNARSGMHGHPHLAHNFVAHCLVGMRCRLMTCKRQVVPQGFPPWSPQRSGRCHIVAAISPKDSHPGRANNQAGTRQVHSRENCTHGKGNLQPRNQTWFQNGGAVFDPKNHAKRLAPGGNYVLPSRHGFGGRNEAMFDSMSVEEILWVRLHLLGCFFSRCCAARKKFLACAAVASSTLLLLVSHRMVRLVARSSHVLTLLLGSVSTTRYGSSLSHAHQSYAQLSSCRVQEFGSVTIGLTWKVAASDLTLTNVVIDVR